MARSAEGSITVGSDASLFEGSGSPVGDPTLAVFVTAGTAAAPTSTVTSTSESEPTASGSAFAHVTSWPTAEQSHPETELETKLRPAGSVSVIVIGPAASSGPALCTTRA